MELVHRVRRVFRARGKVIGAVVVVASGGLAAVAAPTPVEMPAITDVIDLDSVVSTVTTYAGGAIVKVVPFMIAVIIFWKFIGRLIRPS